MSRDDRAESAAIARAAAEQGYEHEPNHEPTTWLRDQLRFVHDAQVANRARICEHLQRGMVGFAAAWAPGNIACRDCSPNLLGVPSECCDRCGQVSATEAQMVCTGQLRLLFALCPACARAEQA